MGAIKKVEHRVAKEEIALGESQKLPKNKYEQKKYAR